MILPYLQAMSNPIEVVTCTLEVYTVLVFPPGAIGFDRMATVVVACRGRSLASLNTEQIHNCQQ